MLPNEELLWRSYINGLSRNINAILAGTYGTQIGLPESKKTRGERSEELLGFLLRKHSLKTVLATLSKIESRVSKQGSASLHDLGIAHSIVTAAMYMQTGNVDRQASVFASSMLFGRTIPRIRELHERVLSSHAELLIGEVSAETIATAGPRLYTSIEKDIAFAINNEKRARNLMQLKLTPKKLLGLFDLVVNAGIDDRTFESFLESEQHSALDERLGA